MPTSIGATGSLSTKMDTTPTLLSAQVVTLPTAYQFALDPATGTVFFYVALSQVITLPDGSVILQGASQVQRNLTDLAATDPRIQPLLDSLSALVQEWSNADATVAATPVPAITPPLT